MTPSPVLFPLCKMVGSKSRVLTWLAALIWDCKPERGVLLRKRRRRKEHFYFPAFSTFPTVSVCYLHNQKQINEEGAKFILLRGPLGWPWGCLGPLPGIFRSSLIHAHRPPGPTLWAGGWEAGWGRNPRSSYRG